MKREKMETKDIKIIERLKNRLISVRPKPKYLLKYVCDECAMKEFKERQKGMRISFCSTLHIITTETALLHITISIQQLPETRSVKCLHSTR